jgi:alkylation response protein AidB-like acyl-CoA dehydrogenase
MDLLPTQDQQDIAETAADVLGNELPTSIIRARRDEDTAAPAAAWQRCAETGLLGLGLPETVGGAECGVPEEALLFREIGRQLSPGPFLSSVLGGHVAFRAGDPALAERITSGEVQVGLVLLEHDAVDAEAGLSGSVHVQDWSGAEYLLVVTPDGAGLLTTASIGSVEPYPSIDAGVRLGTVTADAVPFTAWVPSATEPLFRRGVVLVAAQLVGIAEATRNMSVAYAKTREQFGRPIGVNQSVKHFCANMAVEAERAAAQLFLAAASIQDDAPDAEFQAYAAKVVATDAAHKNSAVNIQVHGGMGFTSEFDGHLFVERVEVLENTLSTRYVSLATIISLPAAL